MALAILTVLAVVPLLPERTSITLVIFLIFFLIATTILFIFKSHRRFLQRNDEGLDPKLGLREEVTMTSKKEENTDTSLVEYLTQDDEKSKPHRARRLAFLLSIWPWSGERNFVISQMAWYYFDEARLAYLNGLFVSTIIMSQLCAEELLRNLYRMSEVDDKIARRGSFRDLINGAAEHGWIDSQLAAMLHRLRLRRNPYAHVKFPTDRKGLIARAVESDKLPNEVIEEDAKEALRVLFQLLDTPHYGF